MGYRNAFTLSILDKNEVQIDETAVIDQLRSECKPAAWALDENGSPRVDTTWDTMDEDLKAFSLKHPTLIFEMYRMGDSDEDRVYTYYKNGKMQECPATITFDDYDESKLE